MHNILQKCHTGVYASIAFLIRMLRHRVIQVVILAFGLLSLTIYVNSRKIPETEIKKILYYAEDLQRKYVKSNASKSYFKKFDKVDKNFTCKIRNTNLSGVEEDYIVVCKINVICGEVYAARATMYAIIGHSALEVGSWFEEKNSTNKINKSDISCY